MAKKKTTLDTAKKTNKAVNNLKNNPDAVFTLREEINAAWSTTDIEEQNTRKVIRNLYSEYGKKINDRTRAFVAVEDDLVEALKYNKFDKLIEEVTAELRVLNKDVNKTITKSSQGTFLTAYDDTSNAYSEAFRFSFGGVNEKAIEAFERMPVLGITASVEQTANTVNLTNKIRSVVRTALFTGQNPREAASIIRKQFGIKSSQAEAIARANIIGAHGQAVVAFKEQNEDIFTGYKWFTQVDERTCRICGPLNGKIFYKSVPPHPAHFNCRCAINVVAKPSIQKILDSYPGGRTRKEGLDAWEKELDKRGDINEMKKQSEKMSKQNTKLKQDAEDNERKRKQDLAKAEKAKREDTKNKYLKQVKSKTETIDKIKQRIKDNNNFINSVNATVERRDTKIKKRPKSQNNVEKPF